MFPIAIRALVFLGVVLGLHLTPWAKPRPFPVQHPSESAAFSPLKMSLANPKDVEKMRRLLDQIPQDSLVFYRECGGRFDLSFGLSEKLSQGHSWQVKEKGWGGWRGRFAGKFSEWSGIPVSMPEPAYAAYIPNDTWLRGTPQWALSNIGIPILDIPGAIGYDIHIAPVWDKFGGADTLVIGVIDAGFNFSHPDLQNRWFVNRVESEGLPGIDDDQNGFVDDSVGWDFVSSDADPSDYNGHGTEVSAVMVATFDNNEGMAGMLPEARVLPIRALDASGHGDMAGVAAAIQYAVAMKVDAINYSIGGNSDTPELKAAFTAARDAGIPVVVAAGNDGRDLDANTPAPFNYGYDNVISVAAVNQWGQFSAFSNYGAQTVDLAAPGEYIASCGVPDRIAVWQDSFEVNMDKWVASKSGDFTLSGTNPLEGKQSVQWVSGANTSLTTAESIDLTGLVGATLWLRIQFTPANNNDAFVVEGQREGDAKWVTLGVMGGSPMDQGVNMALTELDGSRFKLRLRTSSSFTSSGRKLKFDQVYLSALDPGGKFTVPYPLVSGTSIAAPHVTGYVALLKLACERMGIPLTKEKILVGVTQDTACAGRVRSGGHLDVAKGLEFYLKTLPSLEVSDSSVHLWTAGKSVSYTLGISDPDADGYVMQAVDFPEGGEFDAASGKIAWPEGIPTVGQVQLRFLAKGVTTLRKDWAFDIVEGPTSLAPSVITRRPFRAGRYGLGWDALGRRKWGKEGAAPGISQPAPLPFRPEGG